VIDFVLEDYRKVPFSEILPKHTNFDRLKKLAEKEYNDISNEIYQILNPKKIKSNLMKMIVAFFIPLGMILYIIQ